MTTLHLQDIEMALAAEGRGELEELALGYARSHAVLGTLLGQAPPDHVSDHELQARIRALPDGELSALLAPLALVGRVGYELP